MTVHWTLNHILFLTFYTASSDMPTLFATYSFSSTDNASLAFPSSSSVLSTPVVVLEETDMTLIEESTVYTTVSDLTKSFISSKTSFTKSEGSSMTGRYQETPTSFTMESTVFTLFLNSSNPTVSHDTFCTTENANHCSPSGSGDLISTTMVSGQTSSALLEASSVYTTYLICLTPLSAVTFSTTVNGVLFSHQALVNYPLPPWSLAKQR